MRMQATTPTRKAQEYTFPVLQYYSSQSRSRAYLKQCGVLQQGLWSGLEILVPLYWPEPFEPPDSTAQSQEASQEIPPTLGAGL